MAGDEIPARSSAPRMIGDAAGFGHVQSPTRSLLGSSKIQSIPAITANHPDAQLIP
ncbi:MAG: hypothetical protein ACLUNZ_13910 [Evtepia sp.]